MKVERLKLKVILLLLMLCSVSSRTFAQTDGDALRYSQTSITGTARFTSMAGAFGALGGDFSSIAINPAGLGIYRSSEFTLSSSLYMNQVTSGFLGTSATENRFNFNIPNFGFVFTSTSNNSSGWKGWSIGIGLNRINNFQSDTYYEGFNTQNSLLDHFVENANNNNIGDFYEGLAMDADLIYYDSTIAQYRSDLGFGQGVLQRRTGSTRGGMNDWGFSFGTNYDDVLYLGASLGIKSIRYIDVSIYEESDRDKVIPYLRDYSFEQDVTTRGTGVDLKLGIIGRPANWVRLGLAFHTPTVYYLHDSYQNFMSSEFDSIITNASVSSPDGSFDYRLVTPLKIIGSAAFIIQKQGLISADYEMVDYSTMRFAASGASYSLINNLIRKKYSSAGKLRLGGEYRLGNISLRGGYAAYASPFSSGEKVVSSDFSRTSFSGGIGIKSGNYFFDLGYVYTKSDENFIPYELSSDNPLGPVPTVQNEVVNHNFVVTFGAKF